MSESYLKLALLLEEKMEAPEEAQKMYQLGLLNAVNGEPALALGVMSHKAGRPLLKVIQ